LQFYRLSGAGLRSTTQLKQFSLGIKSEAMRKQYYFRQSSRGFLAWDVDRLVAVTRNFPVLQIPLTDIAEISEPFASQFDEPASWNSIIKHIRLIEAADLRFPIILSRENRVMDGMHRVVKALLANRTTIDAVQFTVDPEPDYIGVDPTQLPYEEASS
jgi:hypothetical protein